ncbi:hypothetical protein ACCO45_005026 [Purpureocillium lilacinum]|uniref:Uncharacterized protein n=1 Tax=Purpureocillium lilacinum TaxID=33203 RepID=A0ACC4DWH6_PURLI
MCFAPPTAKVPGAPSCPRTTRCRPDDSPPRLFTIARYGTSQLLARPSPIAHPSPSTNRAASCVHCFFLRGIFFFTCSLPAGKGARLYASWCKYIEVLPLPFKTFAPAQTLPPDEQHHPLVALHLVRVSRLVVPAYAPLPHRQRCSNHRRTKHNTLVGPLSRQTPISHLACWPPL